MATTVLDNTAARDYFTLDGKRSPGVSKIALGGDFKVEIADQRQPLTIGAATVVRGILNSVTTYDLTMSTDADLQSYSRMEAQLLEGARRYPKPRVWAFIDLRLSWVRLAILESISPEKVDKPGGPWIRTVTFHQYGRLKPVGGPLLPPDALDRALAAATAAEADVQARFAAAAASSRANHGQGN